MAFKTSITPTGRKFYELSLQGLTHRPHWVVHLFAALSEHQISIISGHANQVKLGQWESTFLLDFSRSTADALRLDYSGFSDHKTGSDRLGTPKLSRFSLARTADQFLDLRLEGPDQIGFLAAILGRVSGAALFPTTLQIRTVTGQIRDSLILTGIGGRPPSQTAEQILSTMLRSFVV